MQQSILGKKLKTQQYFLNHELTEFQTGSGSGRNLALQTVNDPLREKLMFTCSPENALATADMAICSLICAVKGVCAQKIHVNQIF